MAASKPTSVVLLSGGLDSAVALYWCLREGHRVLPLTFEYHGRPQREVLACDALVEHAAGQGEVLPLERIALPFLREVEDLPGRPPHLRGAPEGYIPARNLVFYSVAASVAEREGARLIVGGHNGFDPDDFPDSSPRFFAMLNALFHDAAWSHRRVPFEVVQPLGRLVKVEVLRLARELDVPVELTWSCYADGTERCDRCGSCEERREAFRELEQPDPAIFA